MLHARTRPLTLHVLALLLLASLALVTGARAQKPGDQPAAEPPFHDYKGVRIGMSADEARKLLGKPTDHDDRQEVFAVSDDESCQVYYDDARKVTAVSITYFSAKSVPTAKAVLGDDAEAKKDGSLYKLVRFPKAGYWVSYTRTAGDSPMTIIAIQRIQ